MTRVEEDAKEGVAETPIDDLLERAAFLPDVERPVPLGHRLEIGSDQTIDVVVDFPGQILRAFRHEPGTAVESPPDPEGDRESVSPLDGPVARAEQPERCPWPGGQHQMTGERCPVPLEQADRLLLGHARTQPLEHPADAARGVAGGPFEVGELLDLVDDAQPIGGPDQDVGGVLHGALRPG